MIEKIKSKVLDIEWRTRVFTWWLLLACLASIVLYSTLVVGFARIEKAKLVQHPMKPDPFAAVGLEAKSAFVWDIVNGRAIYEKNAEKSLPLASLTKVMTALTAAEIAPNLKEVTIEQNDISTEGDSKLKVASHWNIKNLIDYVLLVSSNDGAHALAANAGSALGSTRGFVREMNSLAARIGMKQSIFYNEHGLDNPPASQARALRAGSEITGGAYGSARDMAVLFEYTMKNHPRILEATRYPQLEIIDMDKDRYLAKNTNEIINYIPSPIASKTGYTNLAGGNLVVAYDPGLGRPIIIAVLSSTEEGRFKDMLKLVEASSKYIQEN